MLNLVEVLGAKGCLRASMGIVKARYDQRYMGTPLAACWFINFRCNLRCPFCCKSKEIRSGGVELDFEDKMRLCKAIRLSVSRLYISGGEPTLSGDFGDIVEYCKQELHFKAVGFTTNGVNLLQHEKALLYADSICVSLHGSIDWHQEFVGMDSVMASELLSSLKYLSKNKKTKRKIISFVVTKKNLGQLQYVVQLCKEYGFMLSIAPANDFSDGISISDDNVEYRSAIESLTKDNGDILLGSKAYYQCIVNFKPYRCFPLAIPNIYPDGRVCSPCDKGGPSSYNLLNGMTLDHAVKLIETDTANQMPCASPCFKAGVVERSLFLGKLIH